MNLGNNKIRKKNKKHATTLRNNISIMIRAIVHWDLESPSELRVEHRTGSMVKVNSRESSARSTRSSFNQVMNLHRSSISETINWYMIFWNYGEANTASPTQEC